MKGFSTVEIIISTLIIFALILIAFYYYWYNVEYARIASFIQNVRFLKIASEKYYVDKNKYPNSVVDLLADPYRDYLPKFLATTFMYSPWNTQILLKNVNYENKSVLFLYLEYKLKKRDYISYFIRQKIMKEIYFFDYYRSNKSEYMIFVISFVWR
ncbi:MAG: hypothetical protein RMJ36_01875 [Candidatus Calescibacterium sp.]|nr:hypothetical protein [Candidatus Calescibacterium sp.]MDW8132387.1 hypothetical protein [Candidatus Calescibacterium sp.]